MKYKVIRMQFDILFHEPPCLQNLSCLNKITRLVSRLDVSWKLAELICDLFD